ncbi:MAG TPA: hypothetical protein VJV79_36910 [Polyangiaceae bacterium]|nr:hypothetical protein [Polyangiaceae bacterium]
MAWLVAALCSLLAVRQLALIRRLTAPEPAALLSELLAEAGENDIVSERVRCAVIAELNRRLSDVSFELGLLPSRLTALTRICLASGSALALFGYIGSSSRSPLERVTGLVACAAAGLLGAACVLSVGRMAKQRSAAIREGWDRSSRDTGKALGTSLEARSR